MKYALSLAGLAAVVMAQDSSMSAMPSSSTGMAGSGSNFTTGLVAALNGANLTSLATVLGMFPELASSLEMGNFTVFGPNNAALAPLLADPSAINMTEVANILMYHVSPMTLPVMALGSGMNHTIAPSVLQAPLLGTNKTAPLVLSLGVDGQPRVRTAAQNVTVLGNATYQNILVHVVDQVIMPPMNLTSTLSGANLTALTGALTAVSADLPMALSMTPRLTIFAPVDSAFANISSTIATLNTSQIATVLTNHIINGTVVYSTDITAETTATSAAGSPFTFAINNGTLTVMSGDMAMARVVRSDIPIENGVVHLIDAVLANTGSNPDAAMSAASSYAAAATASPTGGVAPADGNGNSAGTGAATKTAVVGFSLVAALFGGFAILA